MPPKKKKRPSAAAAEADAAKPHALDADMPTAQSAPSAASSAVREAAAKRASKRKREPSPVRTVRAPSPRSADAETEDDPGTKPQKPKSCVHQVAVPPGWKGDLAALHAPTYDGPRAKQYDFVLDPFQETSVAVLERDESVMVAAHTSAGKTVVAEYAIAMAFRDKQRVIYTSPLKALSNQKFRELTEEFGGDDGNEVGLMTGDVSINQNATCVVMTTEVLRSMLYRGSDITREVKWIIFDEVHYMRDRERGVIWEETIIFAPKNARMVFLSATLPNAFQFAQLGHQTARLPDARGVHGPQADALAALRVPAGGEETPARGGRAAEPPRGQLPGADGRAGEARVGQNAGGGAAGRGGGRGRGGGGRGRGGGRGDGGVSRGDAGEDMLNLFKHVLSKQLLPAIVFSFSRRECEEHPKALTSLNFTTDEEKASIREVYDCAIQSLLPEDRSLAAVTKILPVLERGIGIHHSGLLPIVKEIVEILFGEGLLKVLFATETFAMGLNMPARCVVFTAFKKFDGIEERVIAPGEYTQMSGRAGRRGKDPFGTCIMMVDRKMGREDVESMVLGAPQALDSEFRLTYYQILNLLKRASGTMDTEYVIGKSFHHFQHTERVPAWRRELEDTRREREALVRATSSAEGEFETLRSEVRALQDLTLEEILKPHRCLPLLKPGRVIRVREGAQDWGYGVAVATSRISSDGADAFSPPNASDKTEAFIVDTILHFAPGAQDGIVRPASRDKTTGALEPGAQAHVMPVNLRLVSNITTCVLDLPVNLDDRDELDRVGDAAHELFLRFDNAGVTMPSIDPVEDMRIDDRTFLETFEKLADAKNAIGGASPVSKPGREPRRRRTRKRERFIGCHTARGSDRESHRCRARALDEDRRDGAEQVQTRAFASRAGASEAGPPGRGFGVEAEGSRGVLGGHRG
jgi:ATP-dependent RNA helicase DOB1